LAKSGYDYEVYTNWFDGKGHEGLRTSNLANAR